MSNKEIVIDLLARLPEDVSLKDIVRDIEFLAGIKIAQEQAKRGEVISIEETRALIDTWAGQ